MIITRQQNLGIIKHIFAAQIWQRFNAADQTSAAHR